LSFRLKTICGIAFIEAVLLIILVSSVLFFQHSSHNNEVSQRAKSTAQLFATMTKDGVLTTDLASLQNFVHEILTNEDIVYAKVIGDNTILAQGGGKSALSKTFRTDKTLTEVDDGIFDVYAPIIEADHTYGRVELGFSIARIDEVLQQTKNWAISIAVLEIFLVAIFSWVLGTWLTVKLVTLKDASEQIANTGPGFQVNIDGNDEIAQVANAFNHMSKKLNDSYEKLKNQSIAYSKVADLAKRSEAHKSTIISCCLDGMITIDQQGKIVDYNPAAEQIFGFQRDEAINANMADLIIPESFRDMHRKGLAKYIATGDGPILNKRLELEGLHKKGHLFPIELTISAIKSDNEIFFTAFIRDIADAKLAEEKVQKARKAAEQASEAKSRFLAIMSHEIRTPMNVLIGTIGLLKDSSLNSEQKSFITTADDAAKALLNLINDILDFSKIEAEKLTLEREVFNLPTLINKVMGIFANIAEEKQIRLFANIEKNIPEHYCSDPGRLQQILLNLLGNAIKFTKHGQVSISVNQLKSVDNKNHILRFEIQDTGIGITIENQQKLFNEFSQIDNEHNRRYEGSGLGLAISKKLVNLFKGEIGVESQPGQGSKFWFTVELKHEPNALKMPAKGNSLPSRALNILLAEDSDANIVVAKAILEKAGHSVSVAKNGIQAIKLLEQKTVYDLILMDIMMPEMDGIEATRRIRQMQEPVGQLPIIAMTANAMSSDKERCFEVGMNDYMSKPFVVEQLYEKIARLSGTDSPQKKNNKNLAPVNAKHEDEDILLDKNILEKLVLDTSAEVLPDMIGIFLQELDKREKNLKQALLKKDFNQVAEEVHALKSSAGTYGAKKMQNLTIKIDSLCKHSNHVEVEKLLNDLMPIIQESKKKYSDVFQFN